MDLLASKVTRASNNPWLVFVSMVAGIAGLVVTIVLGIWPNLLQSLKYPNLVYYSVIVVTVLLMIFFTVQIFEMSRNTKASRYSYSKIHEINHTYRDALARTILHANDHPTDTILDHVNREVDTLSIVVQKIALIYRELSGRPCMVTIKVCDKRETPEACFSIARSEKHTVRDTIGEQKFSVTENTAFVEARKPNESGVSHFFSPDLIDLEKKNSYKNPRENWQQLYKSCIVVPIRYNKQTDTNQCREIGFLCVDTKARHRLNGTYHVELLAAFADQMYNFLNLSRASLLNDLLKSKTNYNK